MTGMNHERLHTRLQGRDVRLTRASGLVAEGISA
jgi:hypothetical protein